MISQILSNHCNHDSESHDVYYWYINKAKVHELDTANVETKDTILFYSKQESVNKWLRQTLIHVRRSFKKANNKERNIQSTAELKELRSYIPFIENGWFDGSWLNVEHVHLKHLLEMCCYFSQ